VAITATWMQRSAHPAASLRVRSRYRARLTVGSTNSATTSAKWSWSILPYDMSTNSQYRNATATV
jgi:hypothetical protein